MTRAWSFFVNARALVKERSQIYSFFSIECPSHTYHMANGRVLHGGRSEGATRNVECNQGYSHDNSHTTITCLASGVWSPLNAECIGNCVLHLSPVYHCTDPTHGSHTTITCLASVVCSPLNAKCIGNYVWSSPRTTVSSQNRSTEGCSKLKSPETRQVQEILVSTLEHLQAPKWDRTRCPEE